MKFSPIQKKIIQAHLESKQSGNWTAKIDGSLSGLKSELLAGRTCKSIFEMIETRFCSVCSTIMASAELLGHQSETYKAGIRKGFAQIFKNLNIQ
jgi:hypothetical protein